MHAYGLDPETMQRAERLARRYPVVEEIRADALRRRDGMARVILAERHDPTTGWEDAARCETRAQGIRYDAAQKAGTILAVLADFGGISLGHYDRAAWHAVRMIALELGALADAADAERPYYVAAVDRIPDCPTPYAHTLAHHAADAA
jgi:hypothetical protein